MAFEDRAVFGGPNDEWPFEPWEYPEPVDDE